MNGDNHRHDTGEPAPGRPDAQPAHGHGRVRYFGPTNLSVANRVSMASLIAIVALIGGLSYRSIPKEASPEITIPMISITTVYPGVSPKDMETLVTRVLEDELNQVPEIVELTSTSDMGISSVTAEFDADMDMDAALQKVRDRVDLARPELPADAEDPSVAEFNMADFPIMQVNIAGEYGLVRLKELAEAVQDRLEQIPSILEVRLSGGLERVVRVDVDLSRLKFYNLAFDDVIDAIRSENVTIPGGSIEVGALDFLVRVDGEFDDTGIIEDIVVLMKNGRPIYVRDVATVDFGFEDRRSYARLDGAPVVTLDIIKRSGRNIIETADAVKAMIATMAPTFPPTTNVKITSDQSDQIRTMVSSLENNIISGLILVVAVLLFFLGVRNASFVGLSIPLSMLLSFIVMKGLGITLNMVVLFSLILALGMLVDNAIVVVENIYRHLEAGFDRFEAARRGAGEVALPVITSTLTTVGAFLPLLFWPGLIGEFMSFLPQTLIIALSSSLFVALVMIPSLCAVFMRVDGVPYPPMRPAVRRAMLGLAVLALLVVGVRNPLSAVLLAATAIGLITLHRLVLDRAGRWFQERGLVRIIASYERSLRWALVHRATVLGLSGFSFVGAIIVFMMFNAGVEYFPESIPPQTVYARIDVASGTTPDFTNGVAEKLETQLRSLDGMRDAESVVATVSGGSNGVVRMFGGGSGGEGSVAVNFVEYEARSTDVFATLKAMQERLGEGVTGADIKIEEQSMGPPSGPPVSIEISGPEVEELKRLADSASAILKRSPVYGKLEGLKSDMARGRPELVIEVDRERAALYDLTTSEVGMTIRTAIQGSEAAKFRSGKEEYDIVVRLSEEYRSDLDALRDLTLVAEGRQIPLPSVATWRVDEGLGTVKRKDLDRVATIEADARTGEQSNAVLAGVQETLADFSATLPAGYALRYTGQQEEQAEAMAFLQGAFLIALALIALVLTSQFNSALKPLIIMTSVVMSTVGVLIGLVLFRMPFGIIMTGLGVISLAGVVVNNAIILIDYVDLLQSRDGLTRDEALVKAGMTRFRPVILTAVTTVLGLVPLAIGFNIDFFGFFASLSPNIFWGGEQAAWWGPMAIAVIAGLSLATVLTLVVVPVLYAVVDDASSFFRRTFTSQEEPADRELAGRDGSEILQPEDARPERPPRRRRLVDALARFGPGTDPARS